MTPYNVVDLGQHSIRECFVAWRNQAIPQLKMLTYRHIGSDGNITISPQDLNPADWFSNYTFKISTTSPMDERVPSQLQ